MPTARPRIMVTESDELAAALTPAGFRYPGLTRAQLLIRLALDGQRVAEGAQDTGDVNGPRRCGSTVAPSPVPTVSTIWNGCARSGQRVLLDASVLIAYLDAADAQHHKAESLFAREIDDEFAANTLTLAEVLVGPSRIGRLDAARSVLRELEVVGRPFPADAAVRLTRLRNSTGLRMPDCCVLLAAQDTAARVAAFDERPIRGAEEVGRVALHDRRRTPGWRCASTGVRGGT